MCQFTMMTIIEMVTANKLVQRNDTFNQLSSANISDHSLARHGQL